jgi:hypothetical protein
MNPPKSESHALRMVAQPLGRVVLADRPDGANHLHDGGRVPEAGQIEGNAAEQRLRGRRNEIALKVRRRRGKSINETVDFCCW